MKRKGDVVRVVTGREGRSRDDDTDTERNL